MKTKLITLYLIASTVTLSACANTESSSPETITPTETALIQEEQEDSGSVFTFMDNGKEKMKLTPENATPGEKNTIGYLSQLVIPDGWEFSANYIDTDTGSATFKIRDTEQLQYALDNFDEFVRSLVDDNVQYDYTNPIDCGEDGVKYCVVEAKVSAHDDIPEHYININLTDSFTVHVLVGTTQQDLYVSTAW